MLYFKDCRTACNGTLPGGNSTATCCNAEPILSILIEQGEFAGQHALTELQHRINAEVWNLTGVNELVRLDLDDVAWSYGNASAKTLRLRIQYGGFQLVLGPTPAFNDLLPRKAVPGSSVQSANVCVDPSDHDPSCVEMPGAMAVTNDLSRVDHRFFGPFQCECERSCRGFSASPCPLTGLKNKTLVSLLLFLTSFFALPELCHRSHKVQAQNGMSHIHDSTRGMQHARF